MGLVKQHNHFSCVLILLEYEDGIQWRSLPTEKRRARVDKILLLDSTFVQELTERSSGVINLFLFLDPLVSMKLAEKRARATLGVGPDEHERRSDLQSLVGELYREVAEGRIFGHEAKLIEGVTGSMRRKWENFRGSSAEEGFKEVRGIALTAFKIGQVLGLRHYQYGLEAADDIYYETQWEQEPIPFDFREITKREGIQVTSDYREQIGRIIEERSGVLATIEASRMIDERVGVIEGEQGYGKER